jgi:hypothetical protein
MRLLPLALITVALTSAQAGAPQPAPKAKAAGPLSRTEACKQRFAAVCHVVHRCAPWAQDMGGANCEGIDSGCDQLTGASPHTREAVNQCVAELETMACPGASSLDPNDPAALDFEAKATACKALVAAETKAGSKDAVADSR